MILLEKNEFCYKTKINPSLNKQLAMNVYLIKSSIPEEIEINIKNHFELFFGELKYALILNSIEYGFYIVDSVYKPEYDIEFAFFDSFFYPKIFRFFNYLNNSFSNISIEIIDITEKVKMSKYEDFYFQSTFLSENADLKSILTLKYYLKTYLTVDDILDKINKYSILSLNKLEFDMLNK